MRGRISFDEISLRKSENEQARKLELSDCVLSQDAQTCKSKFEKTFNVCKM